MTAENDILTAKSLDSISRLNHLMPPLEEASMLVVACRPNDFSASALAHAVEDSDAHLLNLNVTDRRLNDGRITIELRTNHRNSASTARSLERYGFEVMAIDGITPDYNTETDDTLRRRVAELTHILEI